MQPDFYVSKNIKEIVYYALCALLSQNVDQKCNFHYLIGSSSKENLQNSIKNMITLTHTMNSQISNQNLDL